MFFEITLLISVSFFILFFFVSLLEKQYIQQFVPFSMDPSSASNYCRAVSESARELQFDHLGTFSQDRKSKAYAAVLSFWLSPDGKTLARIGGGKTLGVSIKRTTLISRLAEGGTIETADDFSGPDLSGLSDREIVLNAHLPELFDCHKRRLLSTTSGLQTFPHGNILSVHEDMEMAKANRLSELGLAKPINLQGTIWRYTVKGAWQNYFRGFRRQMEAGKKQSARIRLKRPGAS